MIVSCNKCGGLKATEHLESFAGTPCRCPDLAPAGEHVNTVVKEGSTSEKSVAGELVSREAVMELLASAYCDCPFDVRAYPHRKGCPKGIEIAIAALPPVARVPENKD